MPPEIKELRTRSREHVEKIVLQLYNLNESGLKKIIDDNETSMWEKHAARIILKGIARGDQVSFGFLSDYVFGAKAKKIEVDQKSSDGSMSPSVPLKDLCKDPEVFDELVKINDRIKSLTSPSE